MIHDIQCRDCTKCSFSETAMSVCQMLVDTELKKNMLMVISDFPSKQDAANDTIMHGAKEAYFWDIALNACHVPKDDIYPTYAVKCRPDNGDKPGTEEMQVCGSNYLVEEILMLRPKCILVLGMAAARSLGYEGDISKLRGVSHDLTFSINGGAEKFTTKINITYAPFFVENSPNNLMLFAKDIVRAHNIAIGKDSNAMNSKVKMITTIAGVKQVIKHILTTKECCFDFETTELDELGTYAEGFRTTLLSVSFQHGSSYTIPLWHHEHPDSDKFNMKVLALMSKYVWANPEVRKIGQNIKFDMGVAAHYGFPLFRGRLDDAMLMHHILYEYKKHGLKEYIVDYYPEYGGYEDEVKKHGYAKAPLEILSPYAGSDTDLTFRACTIFENLLMQDRRSYILYRNFAMFILKPLYQAELTGMPVSRRRLERNIIRAKELLTEQERLLRAYPEFKRYEKRYQELHKQSVIDKLVKEKAKLKTEKGKAGKDARIQNIKTGLEVVPFKQLEISSPAQMGGFFYDKVYGLGFPPFYDRTKRQYGQSTDNKALKLANDKTGFVQDFMIWRTLSKNITTYLEGFVPLVAPDSRIHTSFLIHGTRSGRASSRNPNLQNLSKHVKVKSEAVAEVVGMIMKNFVAPKGHTFLSCDFAQAELRIVAELGNVKGFIDGYNAGKDQHDVTAARITKMALEAFLALPKEERSPIRSKAKASNFGLVYGQMALGFMEYARNTFGVEMTLQEATELRDMFFDEYPELLDYHAMCITKARKYGYVRTIFGRKRHALNIHSNDEYLRGQDEREIINSPVQGTCGEMTLFACALLHYRLPDSCKFVNTIHDSIVFLVPNELVPYAAKIMKDTAENLPCEMFFGKGLTKLKLVADIEFSTTSWGEMKGYTEDAFNEALALIK